VPEWAVFRRGRKVHVPPRLKFPVIVKSLTEEASIGISQASVVADEEKLRKRVEFIHQSVGTHAIVERFIDGREMYVGVLGNDRLQVFPLWEMQFSKMVDGDNWLIATERVKWSAKYQEKHGINTHRAKNLPDTFEATVSRMAKRVYRALELTGYARIDIRMDQDGKPYVLEANANPQIARGEDFEHREGWLAVVDRQPRMILHRLRQLEAFALGLARLDDRSPHAGAQEMKTAVLAPATARTPPHRASAAQSRSGPGFVEGRPPDPVPKYWGRS
jgi:hypothetical protein